MTYYRPCRRCTIMRIVVFMIASFALMAMMYFQVPQAVLLAQKIPNALELGMAICILGSLEFLRRLIVFRAQKQTQD